MSNQFIVHGIHRATTEEDMAVVVIFTPNTYTDSIYASDPIGVKIVLWVWGKNGQRVHSPPMMFVPRYA